MKTLLLSSIFIVAPAIASCGKWFKKEVKEEVVIVEIEEESKTSNVSERCHANGCSSINVTPAQLTPTPLPDGPLVLSTPFQQGDGAGIEGETPFEPDHISMILQKNCFGCHPSFKDKDVFVARGHSVLSAISSGYMPPQKFDFKDSDEAKLLSFWLEVELGLATPVPTLTPTPMPTATPSMTPSPTVEMSPTPTPTSMPTAAPASPSPSPILTPSVTPE